MYPGRAERNEGLALHALYLQPLRHPHPEHLRQTQQPQQQEWSGSNTRHSTRLTKRTNMISSVSTPFQPRRRKAEGKRILLQLVCALTPHARCLLRVVVVITIVVAGWMREVIMVVFSITILANSACHSCKLTVFNWVWRSLLWFFVTPAEVEEC